MTKDEALRMALEAMTYADACLKKQLTTKDKHQYAQDLLLEAGTAIREVLAQPEQVPVTDNTYNYAKCLAEAIFKQHFASDEHYASGRIVWGVNDTVIGILTQIDNMVADMVRRPQQPEQVSCYCPNCEELTAQRDKLADILTRTANALKGQPAELSAHSWHDLPEVAQQLKAQPAVHGEPVAYASDVEFDDETEIIPAEQKGKLGTAGLRIPLYIDPPASKPWVGLTEKEKREARNSVSYSPLAMTMGEWTEAVQDATEAKLREKNA